MNNDEEYTPKAMTLKVIERMKYGGCSPMHQTFWLRTIANFYVATTGSMFVLSIFHLIFSSDPITVSSLTEDCLIMVAFLQICAKYYLVKRQAKEILVMLNVVYNNFWSIENGLLSKEEEIKMRFLYKISVTVAYIYGLCALFSVFLYSLHAYLRQMLIIKVWLPYQEHFEQHPLYDMMILWQTFITFTSVYFGVIQVDSLFIFFICFLFVQLQILQKKMATISIANSRSENYDVLKKCIKQHNMLIQFLNDLSEIYGKIFLPTFFTVFFLIVLTIYGIKTEESVNGKVKNLFIFFCVMGQLISYCFGGQIIQDQGSQIAETVYSVDWYKIKDQRLRRGLILIILRANKPLKLSVAGYLILDNRSLAMVMRGCFSFIAFLANIQ